MKTVIITGAASGIGLATVHKYLEKEDFKILSIDKNKQGLDALKNDISNDKNMHLEILAIDLTNEESFKNKLVPAIENIESIDHVVICHGTGEENGIHENDKFDLIFNINLISTQRLLSIFTKKIVDEGRVVILSSLLARVGNHMNTGYVSSKHALVGLTKALALDLAERKITVNAVLPCWVETPMLIDGLERKSRMVGVPTKKLIRKVKQTIPLRSLVSPENVADTIMFLTSPSANMITAQSIVIDGGYGCGA